MAAQKATINRVWEDINFLFGGSDRDIESYILKRVFKAGTLVEKVDGNKSGRLFDECNFKGYCYKKLIDADLYLTEHKIITEVECFESIDDRRKEKSEEKYRIGIIGKIPSFCDSIKENELEFKNQRSALTWWRTIRGKLYVIAEYNITPDPKNHPPTIPKGSIFAESFVESKSTSYSPAE